MPSHTNVHQRVFAAYHTQAMPYHIISWYNKSSSTVSAMSNHIKCHFKNFVDFSRRSRIRPSFNHAYLIQHDKKCECNFQNSTNSDIIFLILSNSWLTSRSRMKRQSPRFTQLSPQYTTPSSWRSKSGSCWIRMTSSNGPVCQHMHCHFWAQRWNFIAFSDVLASTNLEDLTTFMRPKKGPLDLGLQVQHCPEVFVAGDEFARYGECESPN